MESGAGENKMAAHLSGGRVNIGLLREAARRELLNCLDKCPGSKVRYIMLHLESICYGILEFLLPIQLLLFSKFPYLICIINHH